MVSVAAALITMPLEPNDEVTPPSVYWQIIEIDLVMVSPPKPPGSRQLISPAAAVLEIAPAKVLQGAVRLHGLASSPTPETHVRVACACAGAASMSVAAPPASTAHTKAKLLILTLLPQSPLQAHMRVCGDLTRKSKAVQLEG